MSEGVTIFASKWHWSTLYVINFPIKNIDTHKFLYSEHRQTIHRCKGLNLKNLIIGRPNRYGMKWKPISERDSPIPLFTSLLWFVILTSFISVPHLHTRGSQSFIHGFSAHAPSTWDGLVFVVACARQGSPPPLPPECKQTARERKKEEWRGSKKATEGGRNLSEWCFLGKIALDYKLLRP